MTEQGRKTIKFRQHLVPAVLAGTKYATWRLFDDKDISEGDSIDLINWNTGEKCGEADVVHVHETSLQHLTDKDYEGQVRYASDEEMYATLRTYYGDGVGPDMAVKVIRFKVK
ncbi:ASCH domain-containing protein [Candidatus Kaiserbacteria bacterium]|nr:ASCH domain-containing protein [Candidatus Kaiserbacteria bacterium]